MFWYLDPLAKLPIRGYREACFYCGENTTTMTTIVGYTDANNWFPQQKVATFDLPTCGDCYSILTAGGHSAKVNSRIINYLKRNV
ncbi:hypothetical protein [Pseudodesulfovibrio profundus]|uniref:hypothetical protein n=1 Tax=Pseudodesulfovibrio profundus TaxID=57320 RepID=UPI0012FFBDA8|nr:hypothetical protein [Pseudodesulfovibrio profundus]